MGEISRGRGGTGRCKRGCYDGIGKGVYRCGLRVDRYFGGRGKTTILLGQGSSKRGFIVGD
jgi:hypothetical protein